MLLTPAIVSLLGYTDLSAGLRDRDTLVDVDLGFPQLVQDMVTIAAYYYLSVLPSKYIIWDFIVLVKRLAETREK